MLKHGQNALLLDFDEAAGEKNSRILAETIINLETNPLEQEKARILGKESRKLFEEALHPDMVREYWRRLLTAYRDLQSYRPTSVHPDAVPLDVSVLNAKYIDSNQRTCLVCPRG